MHFHRERLCIEGVGRGLRMIPAAFETFGVRRACTIAPYALMPMFTWATMWLDDFFFPAYKRVDVERPVFIVGHPRSGTTFLHRSMTGTGDFASFRMWETLVPSLSARRLIGPIIHRLFALYEKDMADASTYFDDGAHETSLDAVEEEELLFYPIFDTQFAISFTPLAFDDREYLSLVYPERARPRRREASMHWLRECFQRQILASGRSRIVAKMPFSTMRISSLLKAFPDAFVVYLVRSPLETIPSLLSLHRSFFAHRWGLETIPSERLERYYRRRYHYMVALYRHFHDEWRRGVIPRSQLLIVPYARVRSAIRDLVSEIAERADFRLSPRLAAELQRIHDRQAQRRATHTNRPLEDFGLSEAQVRADLAFVWEDFLLEGEGRASGGTMHPAGSG